MQARRECAWCIAAGEPSFMGFGETADGSPTHGICARHLKELLAELEDRDDYQPPLFAQPESQEVRGAN